MYYSKSPLPHPRHQQMMRAVPSTPSSTRTPVAWSLRETNLTGGSNAREGQMSRPDRINHNLLHPNHPHHPSHSSSSSQSRPSASSPSTSTTTASSNRHHPGHLQHHPNDSSGSARGHHPHHHQTLSHPRHHPRYLTIARANHFQQLHHELRERQDKAVGHHHRQSSSSPSASTTESSSDDREEVLMVRRPHSSHHHRRSHNREVVNRSRALSSDRRSVMSRTSRASHHPPHSTHYHQNLQLVHHYDPYGPVVVPPPLQFSGTLRSTKSVPALAFHDGPPPGCPVHGQGQPPPTAYSVIQGPIYGPIERRAVTPFSPIHHPSSPPATYSVVNFVQDKKYPTMNGLPPHPSQIVPPPPPSAAILVPTSAAGKAITYYEDPSCCKGHLIVLWIILSVVTLGVISGIILGVTMN